MRIHRADGVRYFYASTLVPTATCHKEPLHMVSNCGLNEDSCHAGTPTSLRGEAFFSILCLRSLPSFHMATTAPHLPWISCNIIHISLAHPYRLPCKHQIGLLANLLNRGIVCLLDTVPCRYHSSLLFSVKSLGTALKE